jgi:NAD(P)-dependent dehydrogenase (short-subunit alcohol dehydrogenase family)
MGTKPTQRKVVVTGAARGLGRAIAMRFVADGAKVLLVDLDPTVKKVATRLSKQCYGMEYDLTHPDCGDRILAEAQACLGGCDTLINNAAWSLFCPLTKVVVEDFDRLVAINQRAPFLLTQAFARLLDHARKKTHDPCVVHISSVNATSGNVNFIAYAGTKGALESMTRAMAVELAPKGIRVNAVRPGLMGTENARSFFESGALDPEKFWEQYLIRYPTPPGDVADIVAFLCGKSARTITGTVWAADGGYEAH